MVKERSTGIFFYSVRLFLICFRLLIYLTGPIANQMDCPRTFI